MTIRGGEAGYDGYGGGIYAQYAHLVLEDVVVEDNVATEGGGVYLYGGSLHVARSTFRRNDSAAWAGGLGVIFADAVIEDSAFYLNTDGTEPWGFSGGGGIGLASGGDVTIRNTTISRNRSENGVGGGLSAISFCVDGFQCDPPNGLRVRLENVTITENEGGGLSTLAIGGEAPVVELDHTVVSRNTPRGCEGTFESLGHNLFEIGRAGRFDRTCELVPALASDLRNVSPGLGDLAPNGGPTLSHLPRLGSPLIDGGAETCVAADQRGVPRPEGDRCDIGAIERDGGEIVRSRRPAVSPRRIPRR
jgi:hypothetical protein